MKKYLIASLMICFIEHASAQAVADSIVEMENLLVKGFESNSKIKAVPASISVISKKDFQKVSTFSMLPAFNMIPGVRMEERSPGSYRLSMRGSLLRSPFGVRNVKIYLNDFMLTDAGGNTYINLLDISGIEQAEVIKGPAGSLYGAGTGGAILLTTPSFMNDQKLDTSSFHIALSGGSYGAANEQVSYRVQSKNFSSVLSQVHNQSDGYRQQSRLRKDNIQYAFKSQSNPKISTEGIVLLSDLYYQTPGGLNPAQFAANPRQARPATQVLPSAIEQHASVRNRTALIGLTNTYTLSDRWKTVTSFTTSFTSFINPFITQFEKRTESNLGLRTKLIYEKNNTAVPLQWVTGAEVQRGKYKIDSSGNNKGVTNGISVVDQVSAKQLFAFSQLSLTPVRFIKIQTGLSVNAYDYQLKRTKGLPMNNMAPIEFNPQVLPRIALMIDPVSFLGIYVQFNKGYSAPTIAEIRPSAGGFYTGLQAEYGWNKEVGIKLSALHNRLNWVASVFDFRLKDAIVRQLNGDGAEYFVNAGGTIQKGFESHLELVLVHKSSERGLHHLKVEQSVTMNNFKFTEYTIAGNNFDGKKLTGVPNEVIGLNIDAAYLHGFYSTLNFNYIGKLPLNDGNTAIAEEYRIWRLKTGLKKQIKHKQCDFFILVDNIGNEKYSLGNDLNAFGSRYYNCAPGRTVAAGVSIDF